jgi:hypothetical protein
MEGQVGPWRTRGYGPAARTPRNLDPREAGWGPTCNRRGELALQRAHEHAIRQAVPPRVPQSVRHGGPRGGTHPSAWDPCLMFDSKRMPPVSRESTGSRIEGVSSSYIYAVYCMSLTVAAIAIQFSLVIRMDAERRYPGAILKRPQRGLSGRGGLVLAHSQARYLPTRAAAIPTASALSIRHLNRSLTTVQRMPP